MVRKSAVVLAAGVIASELLWQLYKRFTRRKSEDSLLVRHDREKIIAEVLFFSEESSLCRLHAAQGTPCPRRICSLANVRKIMSHLKSAMKSLDVCMYMLTHQDLSKCIVDALGRRVVVRVIVDATMAENQASQVLLLRRAGVRVRTKQSEFLMHHKFALIDGRILITGSTNWTSQAVFGNFDNVLVTNRREFVSPFAEEFDRMWNILDSEPDKIPENLLI
ncbi:mitochondrial cardiolipin hydrolase isoform X2 [Orussus abietinus]|nr:mitochondrial cardiolipin hydrolase isoform X2 [Orussus abietinus]XP_023287497.1 mitochondrial cardiolipin hydrolase isoform X2 [Orussus abietinus]XP_023287498.1 mitochondrial cardiolipin hydrolase isoform X2 [Orussus abietinus]